MSLTLITAPALEPITVAELRRHLGLSTTAGEPAPAAPTVALASPAAPGDCDAGAWRVGVTFVDADGETELGPLSAAVTVANPAVNGQLTITNLAIGGATVTARKLYAVAPGETVAKLAATVANNTADTATLSIAAGSLGVQAPAVNTTGNPQLSRLITGVRERCELATRRALVTQTWDWVLDGWGDDTWIEIPKPPLQSITHVKYRDTQGVLQTWAASNYVVEAPAGPRAARGRLALAYGVSWPTLYGQLGDVTIRFVAGYGAAASSVPALLRQGMLLDAHLLYAHPEGAVTGANINKLPFGTPEIYWSYKSHPAQARAA